MRERERGGGGREREGKREKSQTHLYTPISYVAERCNRSSFGGEVVRLSNLHKRALVKCEFLTTTGSSSNISLCLRPACCILK